MTSDADAKLSLQRTPCSELVAANIADLVNSEAQEDQHLEFKRTVLENSTDQAKAELRKDVAALANGGGGTLIVGIDEDKDSKAIAIPGVFNAVERVKQIEAVLLDCIDPPLQGLAVHRLTVDAVDVVIVRVEPPAAPPHCIHTGQWTRRFPVRQGRHVRPMTMIELRQSILGDRLAREVRMLNDRIDELLESPLRGGDLSSLDNRQLLELRNPDQFSREIVRRISERYEGRPTMLVLGVPDPLPDDQPLRRHQDELREILLHPPDVRSHGWFIRGGEEPARVPLGMGVHDDLSDMGVIGCWNGSTVFYCALDTESAQWAYQELAEEGSPVLNPFAYIEPTVRTVALAKQIAGILSITTIHLFASLVNAANIRLTKYPKNSFGARLGRRDAIRPVGDDNILVSVPNLMVEELCDSSARELIREIYAEIGFDTRDQEVLCFDEQGNFRVDSR